MNDIKIVKKEENISIFTPYNPFFVSNLKNRFGNARWNGECWTIPSSNEAEKLVYELLKTSFGYTKNGKKIKIKITSKRKINRIRDAVYFCGIQIARAFNRDSGAKLGNDIIMKNGNICSGGSTKHWKTIIDEKTSFIIPEIYEKAIENKTDWEEEWTVEIIPSTEKVNKKELMEEKKALEKRLKEIKEIIENSEE